MQLSYGWFPASIGDFIRENVPVFFELPFVVLAATDSSEMVSSMPFARVRSEELEPENGIFVVSGNRVVELAIQQEIFFGFDEIWIPNCLGTLTGA